MIRKITNETHYIQVMERIDFLLKLVDGNTPNDDINLLELVFLSNLVADYEDIHYPIRR